MEAEPEYFSLFDDVQNSEGWDRYREGFERLGLTDAIALIPESR